MQLTQIADRVACPDREDAGLADALAALSDQIDAEIYQLAATRAGYTGGPARRRSVSRSRRGTVSPCTATLHHSSVIPASGQP